MDQDQFRQLMALLGRIETRLSKLDHPATSPEGARGGFPLGRLSVPPGTGVSASALAGMPALSDVPAVPQLPPLLDQ